MYNAPLYLEALLTYLENELDRVMWNIHQEEYASPFRNTGNTFECPTFKVRAYYWGDDDEEYSKPNFEYKDIQFMWYKHVGRDLRVNRQLAYEEAIEMFNECLLAIWEYEWENREDKELFSKPEMEFIQGYECES